MCDLQSCIFVSLFTFVLYETETNFASIFARSFYKNFRVEVVVLVEWNHALLKNKCLKATVFSRWSVFPSVKVWGFLSVETVSQVNKNGRCCSRMRRYGFSFSLPAAWDRANSRRARSCVTTTLKRRYSMKRERQVHFLLSPSCHFGIFVSKGRGGGTGELRQRQATNQRTERQVSPPSTVMAARDEDVAFKKVRAGLSLALWRWFPGVHLTLS